MWELPGSVWKTLPGDAECHGIALDFTLQRLLLDVCAEVFCLWYTQWT